MDGFKIQDLLCWIHSAHLLRPTYSENLWRNHLLIPLGNFQADGEKKTLYDLEEGTKRRGTQTNISICSG